MVTVTKRNLSTVVEQCHSRQTIQTVVQPEAVHANSGTEVVNADRGTETVHAEVVFKSKPPKYYG